MIGSLSTLRTIALAAGLLALSAAPALAQPRPPAEPISSEGLRDVAAHIARELVSQLAERFGRGSPPLAIAVQPIDDNKTELPPDIRDRVTFEIESALTRAGGQRFGVVPRAQLGRVWAANEDFSEADIQERLRQAKADIQVLPSIVRLSGATLNLAYQAIDVRANQKTQVVATAEIRQVSVDQRALLTRDFEPAVAEAARVLATRITRGTLTQGEPFLQETGRRDPIGDAALQRLFSHLGELLPRERVRAGGPQAFTGDGETSAPERTKVVIEAVVQRDGDRYQITFNATLGNDRGPAIERRILVWEASIDPSLRATASVTPGGRFSADGVATIVPPFDEASAVRAARALARARVVAQAQGRPLASAPSAVRDVAQATWAVQALAGGITTDERWGRVEKLEQSVRVSLDAQVVSLDRGAALDLKASLPVSMLRAGTPFTLQITTAEAASVAVFGWIADDTVVRLYPYGRQRDLRTAAREPLVLPRQNEPPFMSEPRPGVEADFEALVVIASKAPLAYDRLAREVGATVEETMANARPVQDFLRELATLAARPDAAVALKVVPYTVYNP